MKTVIFTDLDGTFLNHNDYSFSESSEALSLIFKKNIPLIFTTSKTKIEVELLQKEVGIKEPFIVENGAAIFIPKGYQNFDFSFLEAYKDYYVLKLGVSYSKVLSFYNNYKNDFGMLGFSDMTDDEVVNYTGLSIENARLSKIRDFTEPFILKKEALLSKLEILAKQHSLKITKGGRFYHLIGENQDKGKAVKECITIFEKIYGQKVRSIGLGDGQNDIALLNNVTVPVAIQNHKGAYVTIANPELKKSKYQGAKGWNQMIIENV